jgi:hypothetical protein
MIGTRDEGARPGTVQAHCAPDGGLARSPSLTFGADLRSRRKEAVDTLRTLAPVGLVRVTDV